MEFLPDISKWTQALLRWAHVFFAILWVGTSFTFNYLDNKLPKNTFMVIILPRIIPDCKKANR